jgi:ketosteroid isomerase-like protein
MGDTASTERSVSRYFTAWTSRDTGTVRDLLAEDFRFSGMGMEVKGRDAFQMYDASRDDTTVRIVEHLRVEDGKIVASTLVTDSGAYLAFRGMV